MSETSDVRILRGDPKMAISAMTLPIAVAVLIQSINGMADFMWVSWLGGVALGGLGLAYPLYATVTGIGLGLAVGASATIARFVGVRDQNGASHAAGQAIFLSAIIAVCMTAVLVPTVGPLMEWYGEADAARAAVEYSMPMFVCAFLMNMSSVMSGILRGEGAARASMKIQVAGAMTNIILDPILIYGLDMGVAGAGWATVIAATVTTVLGLLIYREKNGMYVVLRPGNLKPNWGISKSILVVGVPQAMEYAAMSLLNLPMNYFIVQVGGSAAVGIYTAAWRICYIVLVPANAYGGAVVSVCSAEYAMKRPDMVREAYSFAVRRSVKYTIYACIALAILAWPISVIYTAADDLQDMSGAMVFLFIAQAVMLPFMSQVFVGSSFLQSLKHSEIGLLSSFVRNILMIILYGAAATFIGSVESIWVMMALSEIIGGLLMFWCASLFLKRFECDVSLK